MMLLLSAMLMNTGDYAQNPTGQVDDERNGDFSTTECRIADIR